MDFISNYETAEIESSSPSHTLFVLTFFVVVGVVVAQRSVV